MSRRPNNTRRSTRKPTAGKTILTAEDLEVLKKVEKAKRPSKKLLAAKESIEKKIKEADKENHKVTRRLLFKGNK